jgi:Protein of unknown function (DUF2793)
MTETTARLALPMLAVAQAQKEMTHNEALAKLDATVQPVVVSVAPSAVPVTPAAGQCWIVGTPPTGAWAGQAGALAVWTVGGWRFVAPFDGMSAWSIADMGLARRESGVWRIAGRQPAISTPAGGTTIDAESRTAVAAILAVMRSSGLIAT